jgi:EAL domain-containing protein (putative c-di-GMP-specific phosphodiesterase class I)
VETREQLELLQAAGCREVQGYLLSRPMPASNLNFESPKGLQRAEQA